MKPIPKFTSGMFKKKVKQYGASKLKPPSVKIPKKMASGGSIDGCAKRGKTRGVIV
jgi:hypothetical protein